MAKLCMGCMNPLPQGSETCSVCGYNPVTDKNPDHCLPAAVVLQGHYIVGRCVGEYGDHLSYLAYDKQLREPCLIQEFYPSAISRRDSIGGVQPLSGCDRIFEEYANQYRNNMRILARLRELPAVIPVYDIFEENGTVYAASDYCEGMTLTKKIKMSGGRLPWAEARPLFMSLLSCLTQLNEAGIYHLGICPDNILIGSDGKPRLRNFTIPAARQAGTDLTPQLTAGYAAPEQYQMGANIGAAADVYGVAATVFRAVTGNEPPPGNNRAKNSDDLFMPAEVAEELTQQACIALFNALQVAPENRTGTVAELRDQLSAEPTVSALVNEVKVDRQNEREQPRESGGNGGKIALIVICCVLAALVVIGGILWATGAFGKDGIFGGNGKDKDKDKDDPTTTTSQTIPSWTEPTTDATSDSPNQVSVPSVTGKNYYELREKALGGNLTLKIESFVYSAEPRGTILKQTPDPQSVMAVDKGSTISVVVSIGRPNEYVSVPNLAGWKQEHAKEYLESLGFQVEIVELQASNYEKGIVEGTSPVAGSQRLEGDTVTLRVSMVEKVEPPQDDTTQTPPDETTP